MGEQSRPRIALVAAFAGVRVAAGALDSAALFALGQALWALGSLLMAALLVRHALRRGPVDRERIFAALDAYVLGATGFGVVYWLLDSFWPGSFGPELDASLAPDEALYMGLVALTTLPFGDLLPVDGAARSLATLEAISGQMYLAVPRRPARLWRRSAPRGSPASTGGSRS